MARRPFNRFMVGFRGGTSGGRGAPSSRQPERKLVAVIAFFVYNR